MSASSAQSDQEPDHNIKDTPESGCPTNSSDHLPAFTAFNLMPTDTRSKDILSRRAEALAGAGQEQEDILFNEEYIRFLLGPKERYGISYRNLEEITYANQIFKVPCTPEYIAGVTNWRGNLLTVLNLQSFFHTDAVDETKRRRIIVTSSGHITAGILVDRIEENDIFVPEVLAPPLSSEGISNPEYIMGLYQGCITILDIDKLLNDEKLLVKVSSSN